jgi:hypothetical protein
VTQSMPSSRQYFMVNIPVITQPELDFSESVQVVRVLVLLFGRRFCKRYFMLEIITWTGSSLSLCHYNISDNVVFWQPYVPDFWDSSVPVDNLRVEESLPKLLVVAGADTHPGGGPSHNLLDANLHHETVSSDVNNNITAAESATGQGKVWDDIAEDVGLPYWRDIKAGFWKTFS